jgi:hypothetical protein
MGLEDVLEIEASRPSSDAARSSASNQEMKGAILNKISRKRENRQLKLFSVKQMTADGVGSGRQEGNRRRREKKEGRCKVVAHASTD